MPPSQLFPGAMPWGGVNTENSVIREREKERERGERERERERERVTLKKTILRFELESRSVTPSKSVKEEKEM